MNIFRLAGVAVGLGTGIILCVVLFRYGNKDKKIKTSYDERQEAIRGVAFKYAFYTILVYEMILMAAGVAGITFPFPEYVVNFLGIMLGCTVLGVYCIWKDVFWGLNNNRKRYYVIYLLILLLNLFPIIIAGRSGGMILNQAQLLNIMVIIMLTVLFVTMVLKSFVLRDHSGEDEV